MTVPLVDGTGSVAMDAMVPEQMTYQEQAIGGARLEDRLPMLILLHGKFGRPEYISAPFAGLHTPARLIALRGVPMGNGFVWWDQHEKTTDPRTFAAAANEASRRVDAFVRRLVQQKPTLGKPIFVGFSQGAMLTYAVTVRDPDLVGAAFPLSGMLPLGLEPAAWPPGRSRPRLHAFHGLADAVVDPSLDRESVARLQGLGLPATLTELPGLQHALGPIEMGMALPEIDAALAHEGVSGH